MWQKEWQARAVRVMQPIRMTAYDLHLSEWPQF